METYPQNLTITLFYCYKYYCGRSNDIAWKPKKKPDATTRTHSAPLLRLQQNTIDTSRASHL